MSAYQDKTKAVLFRPKVSPKSEIEQLRASLDKLQALHLKLQYLLTDLAKLPEDK